MVSNRFGLGFTTLDWKTALMNTIKTDKRIRIFNTRVKHTYGIFKCFVQYPLK